MAVAFDTPSPTFRHERFPEYKAQRPPTPPELRGQFDRVKELMATFAVPIYELPGYEADDIIGTLSRQAEAAHVPTVILTGDRDTFQLISPMVRVDLASSERDRRIVDEEELAARYGGLTAEQQPDYKALVGDKSDNIPGVQGVGDKTATTLLSNYGTLEGIYEHLEEITQKRVRNNLGSSRDEAFEYRFLTTIKCDAPTSLDLEACKFGNYERAEVVALMTALEFHSIVGRVPSPDAPWATATESAERSPVAASSGSSEPGDGDYRVIDTQEDLETMIAAIQEAGSFAFDTEASGTDPMAAELAGLSFAVDGGQAWYVPVGHTSGQQLPLEDVMAAVRPLFTAESLKRSAHNANYDLTLLSNYGVDPYEVVDHDTMIAAHLLGNNRLGLKPLALSILGREMTEITDLIGKGARQKTFNEVEIADGAPYAAADADCTLRLRRHFEPPLETQGLGDLFADVEIPLVPVFVEMQRAGVRLGRGHPPRDVARPARTAGADPGGTVRVHRARRQHQFPQTAERPAVRRTGPAQIPAHAIRLFHGRQRAGGAERAASGGGQDSGLPAGVQAEVNLCRCAAGNGEPRHGSNPHVVPPDGFGHGPGQQQRSQPPEHTSEDGTGPAGAPGLRGRYRLPVALRRLFADRTAGAGAYVAGPVATGGLPAWRGHSRCNGEPDVQRTDQRRGRRTAPHRQGAQLRRDLRVGSVRDFATDRVQSRRGQAGSSIPTCPATRASTDTWNP